MTDPQSELKEFQSEHEFFVAIDSDGSAFDTMEIKHKECFIPNIIKYWNLQPVSKYARQAAEFVNLYSKWRGINRFPGLIMVFDLLSDWKEVKKRRVQIPKVQSLRNWVSQTTRLDQVLLQAKVEEYNDPDLKQALEWSQAINASVADMVRNVPPFPHVQESLDKISQWADIIVCSAMPYEGLKREWEEYDLARYIRVFAGQEMGSKKEHINLCAKNKYKRENVLMIGDAPGDMRAARANNAKFYPVNPGYEEQSWEIFFKDASDRFFEGNYSQKYEAKLVQDFEKLLPGKPPWK